MIDTVKQIMIDNSLLTIEQLKQQIEYAKYDIDPQGTMTEWMIKQIQIEIKKDLNNISNLVNELEEIIKGYE